MGIQLKYAYCKQLITYKLDQYVNDYFAKCQPCTFTWSLNTYYGKSSLCRIWAGFVEGLSVSLLFKMDKWKEIRCLSGKSHGQRSLVGCSPWGCEESYTIERLHFHFSLSCIGEGNGNPLQCSCLENPRDGGAWWAAVYGVAQSRTQLTRFSSSSSNGD